MHHELVLIDQSQLHQRERGATSIISYVTRPERRTPARSRVSTA
jgi:hypothetical protein